MRNVYPEHLARISEVPAPTIRWWRLQFGVAAGYDRRVGFTFAQALEVFIVALLTRRGFTARDACAIVVAARMFISNAADGAGNYIFVGLTDTGCLDVVEAGPTSMLASAAAARDDDNIAIALDLRAIALRFGFALLTEQGQVEAV